MTTNAYMDQLVTYASQYFPGFAGRLRGATPEQIAELEQLVGHPLPDDYRQYLERMGEYGISISFDGGSRVGDVLTYYQQVRTSGLSLPPNCIIIGPGDRLSSVALQEEPGQQPHVVLVSSEGEITPHAESLPKMLFRQMFYDGHNASAAWVGLCDHQEKPRLFSFSSLGGMPKAQQEALSLGFREEWFSDTLQSCYEKFGVAISLSMYDRQGVDVLIWADTQENVQELSERLRGTLRLPVFRIYPASMFRPTG